MATTLPKVTVTRIEPAAGWKAHCHTCHTCDTGVIRSMRVDADEWAARHRATHGRPDPADRVVAR